MTDIGNLARHSAREIAEKVRRRELSALEVARFFLERIQRLDPRVKAFLRVFPKEAEGAAKKIDEKVSRGEPVGRLAGVPVAIKDNILVEGTETTCASKILEGFVAPYDASVVQKLKQEDAILIGKTNLDEFAMGSSTENSAYFPTRNPWDLRRVPGGSSGGSAAAVACRMAPLALGSDTGGSIRQPAALCGVVGLKPTYGAVSRYGLIAFASSLDQIGPLANDVADLALLFRVIGGHDPKDSTSLAGAPADEELTRLKPQISGLRIGLPREYFTTDLDREVAQAVERAAKNMEKLGARLSQVSLPHTRYAVSTYYLIAPSEASANLARFDGIRYGPSLLKNGKDTASLSLETLYEENRGRGFGPEVKRRIMLGTYALSSGYYQAYYGQAQKARTLIRQDFEAVFQNVDLLLTPTAPTAAFLFGEKTSNPLQMYLSDALTIPANLAGLCGLSLPCGKTGAGAPIGLQLLGPPLQELRLLQAAFAYQESFSWEPCPLS
ncbi:MAG: Asp-tRNA(Asn)/Glu-tRNA(Gln) amidotransferase subunit GatA [Elusimicrobia bacterium]|nr:Asp-tRNA(Asn)/Glu-tRNA(Gln) amidotransferase subunit GatA [Elusimicrobiota bacterium]